MSDHLLRALSRDAGILIEACSGTELAREGVRRHETSALASILLGRGLIATVMMGTLLKVRQRIALKLESNGPMAKLVTESNSRGRVRGYISPNVIDLATDSPSPGLLGLFGNVGILTVTKDLRARELSNSSVPLEESDIDANLVLYYARSEQVPTVLQTGIKLNANNQVEHAGGWLLQAMPGADEAVLRLGMDRLQQMPAPDDWFGQGRTSEEAVATIMGDVPHEILEQLPVEFKCSCSRARTQRALEMIGRDEILSMADEGEAVVDCHFCHEQYIFSREDLKQIADSLS